MANMYHRKGTRECQAFRLSKAPPAAFSTEATSSKLPQTVPATEDLTVEMDELEGEILVQATTEIESVWLEIKRETTCGKEGPG